MAGSKQTAPEGTGMQKTLSIWNYFTIGFGAIIGTGWVLLVGDWMIIGGGPIAAMIAFFIGALFLLPIGAVFGELTAAIPISGGIVEYVDRTFGKNVSYITGSFLALGTESCVRGRQSQSPHWFLICSAICCRFFAP